MDNGIVVTQLTVDQLMNLLRQVVREEYGNGPAVAKAPEAEIIDADELCKRLNLSLNTIVRYRRKGKIPFFMIGDSIRYNWHAVLKAIESKNPRGVEAQGK